MDRTSRHGVIKRLLAEVPRGAPFDVAALGRAGVSPQAAAQYAKRGWLERLGQGIYAFPGDRLTEHGAAKLLQTRVKGLHVGGKSALALQGVRHNLSARSALVLWGDTRFVLPEWFTSRYPARYLSTRLFEWPDEKLSPLTITTPPGVTEGLRVSSPERAALEMLYEVGVDEDLEEARNVFEGLRNIRKQVTGSLLSCCTSVKAVRLFLTWAGEAKLLDVESLRKEFKPRVGSNRRWISRMRDGTLLTLKADG